MGYAVLAMLAIALTPLGATRGIAAPVDGGPRLVHYRGAGGKLLEFSQPSRLSDEDWLKLEYPEGGRRPVGVQLQIESSGSDANGTALAGLIEGALMSTHNVAVLDPAFRRKGRGPQFILRVRVTECDANKRGRKFGGIGGGFISKVTHGVVEGASIGSQQAEVGITIQLLSAESGQILESADIKGKSTALRFGATGVSAGGLVSGDVESWSNPAIASAMRIAAAKLAFRVYQWVGSSGPA